jgi:hypothetical protein
MAVGPVWSSWYLGPDSSWIPAGTAKAFALRALPRQCQDFRHPPRAMGSAVAQAATAVRMQASSIDCEHIPPARNTLTGRQAQ